MKKVWIVLVLSIHFLQLPAQNKPVNNLSLQPATAQSDSDRLKIIKKAVGRSQYTDSVKAFKYAQEGLSLALKDTSTKYTWQFYELLGNLSRLQNNYKQVFYYFNKELGFAKQKTSALYTILSYRDLGLAYQAQSKFTDAQQNFLKALSVCENTPGHPRIGLIYDDIATIYNNEDQNSKAMEYVRKAMQEGDKKDTLALEKGLEIMGAIAYQHKQIKEAREFHMHALHLYQLQKDSIGVATMYMQIASTYDETYPNAQQCLAYGFKSKAIWDKTNPGSVYALYNMDNISMAYWNMVKYLDTMPRVKNRKALQQSLAIKARHSFEETYRLSTKYANTIAALFALDKLSKVEFYEGEKDKAYQNMRLYNTIHDSLYSQQNISKINQLENQREIDIRDKQLQIKQLQIANQRKQAILLIGSIVFLVGVAVLIYLRSRNRNRVNKQLAQLNKELDDANNIKNKFFGILNHDLKRPVADLVAFRRLQQNEPGLFNELAQKKYEESITASAEHLLATMDDLLLWSKGQMENFKPEFEPVHVSTLFGYIKATFFNQTIVTISFKQHNSDDATIFTDAHYMKTIMLNLTNNAVNALSQTALPQIVWEFLEDNEYCTLTITDNGPGADEQKFRPLYDDTITVGIKNGLGMHIIRDLAKAIGGQIKIAANKPTGVRISLSIRKKSTTPIL